MDQWIQGFGSVDSLVGSINLSGYLSHLPAGAASKFSLRCLALVLYAPEQRISPLLLNELYPVGATPLLAFASLDFVAKLSLDWLIFEIFGTLRFV